MKTRTSVRAGGQGCSPETLNYMNKAVNMANKIEKCAAKYPTYPTGGYYYPYPPATTYPPTTGTTYPPASGGTTYPDMSGACG